MRRTTDMAIQTERSRSRGFTLMELMIVIAIIGLLVSLSIVVGRRVVDSGRRDATQNVIQVLDTAMQSYLADPRVGGVLPATVAIPEFKLVGVLPPNQDPPRLIAWPMSDLRNLDFNASSPATVAVPGRQMINSVGLFMYAVRNSGSELAKSALDRLPTRYTGLFDPDGRPPPDPPSNQPDFRSTPDVEYAPAAGGSRPTWDGGQYRLMTAFDAWRNPIRLVHPALDGAIGPTEWNSTELSGILPPTGSEWGVDQISRTFEVSANPPVLAEHFGDGDSGVCEGSTPYFYSAGPDGRVGIRREQTGVEFVNYDEDNVYTRQPKLTRARQVAR